MNKKLSLLIISIIIGAAALAGALLCEKKIEKDSLRPTLNMSDEEIQAQPYFELVAAKGENRNIPCDIVSISHGDGYIHLYLPDNTDADHIAVYVRDAEGNYLARRVYDLTKKATIGPWEIVLDHHDLPVLYFNSDNPNIYKAMSSSSDKNIVCNGNIHMIVNSYDIQKNGWYREYLSSNDDKSSDHSASLQGRGNASWEWSVSKRSYTLRLGKSMNLLGMGKSKGWNLIGNAIDPSLLKNYVFNEISDEAGIPHQPRMRAVNLYVDGVYQGVYNLTTKIKEGTDRVPLTTGDYLFKIDPPKPDQPVYYTSTIENEDEDYVTVADLIYPEEASEEELENASRILQNFIDVIEDPVGKDLSEICDIDELARYYWIQEAGMNYDAWERSVYIYYTKNDGKIHFGPVWDMDLTLGFIHDRHGLTFDSPEGWNTRTYGWYDRLMADPEFVDVMNEAYQNGGVRDALFSGMDKFKDYKEQLGDDAYLNYSFFGRQNMGYSLDHGDSYDEYCSNMIEFYRQRIEWIDRNTE